MLGHLWVDLGLRLEQTHLWVGLRPSWSQGRFLTANRQVVYADHGTYSFFMTGVYTLSGAEPEARAGLLVGGTWTPRILALVPFHWWVGLCLKISATGVGGLCTGV